MAMFNKVLKGLQKSEDQQNQRMSGISNKVMDILGEEKVTLSEMGVIFINLLVNYQHMILQENHRLKQNERNTKV